MTDLQALVIGDTGGIGQAVAGHLRTQGWRVDGLSRSRDGIEIADEASVAHHLSALRGPYDLIFVATGVLNGAGVPPEKTLKSLTPQAMAAQFAVNTIGPAMVLKHGVRLLPRDRRAVFATLSARVGSIGDNRLGGWYAYRAAKAAVNQVVHGAAIEIARSHPQAICVALHPGTVATRFTRDYAGRHPTVSPARAAANLIAVCAGLTPEDSGGFYDWSGTPVPW